MRRALTLAALALAYGCSTEVSVHPEADTSGSVAVGVGGAAASASGTSSSGVGGAGVGGLGGRDTGNPCVPGNTQCTNCVDDDGDGVADAWDPDCTSPLDNDETSFDLGIPDRISRDPCKQDCKFDGNSGSGDDNCFRDLKCDPESAEPYCPYDASKMCLPQPPKCIDMCLGITPNGCDCFGCCEFALPDASKVTVRIGVSSLCNSKSVADSEACKPCTQVTDCLNPCDACEYCLGKDELPSGCASPDGGLGGQGCSTNQTPCSPTVPCPAGDYCLTGCCIPIPT